MNLPLFLARRMARSSSENRPGVMERIAVVSVALGVAVMILALAVILGFKREVSERMAGFAAHVSVTDLRGVGSLDAEPVVRSAHVEELIRAAGPVVSVAPYALRGGIIRTDEAVQGVVLKGVDDSYDWSLFERWLVEGTLPRVGDSIRTKDVLLSRTLARGLHLGVGDRIEMLFVEPGELPRRDRFKVSGIYASGMDDIEEAILLTDLRNVQRLADWRPEQVSGYEILLADVADAEPYAAALNETLFYDESDDTRNLVASSVMERYPNIFDWLSLLDMNVWVILILMVCVAGVTMVSGLLILILERTSTIGLLKAMGATNAMVRHTFIHLSVFIIVRGLIWGNVIGLGLVGVQAAFGIVKLDPVNYYVESVPVLLNGWLILGLNVGTLLVTTLALVGPSFLISRIQPAKAIRFD